jgi:hypothetical protein
MAGGQVPPWVLSKSPVRNLSFWTSSDIGFLNWCKYLFCYILIFVQNIVYIDPNKFVKTRYRPFVRIRYISNINWVSVPCIQRCRSCTIAELTILIIERRNVNAVNVPLDLKSL